ncbi:hypothetical protein PBAL39_17794 [Pedobacter sp. BAL39]|uniref:hypothetical protein n=1 Tax=Pedobacter sp. BAL39 TaxID=391596 RepID=UPI0001559CEF|nr:hypothetical protein [Pedobacter sp. BAL39]EDM36751.1 hypothetical protein PBAL39_17794 [Pedobacter sp. BAL39]
MKSKADFLRSSIAILLVALLPLGVYARDTAAHTGHEFRYSFQDNKKRQEKKKPDVKEVPKSRKQSKPGKPGRG